MTILFVGVGGFLGAIARYLLDGWVTRAAGGPFPIGILAINVSGSFALGVLYALTAERGVLPDSIRAPVLVGFIGAYTTFSTLTLDTWRLVENGTPALAMINLGGSVLFGMTAVVAGLVIGRAV